MLGVPSAPEPVPSISSHLRRTADICWWGAAFRSFALFLLLASASVNAQDIADRSEAPRIVCLHAGDPYYQAFLGILAEHLRADLQNRYIVESVDSPAGAEGFSDLTGAMDILSAVGFLSAEDRNVYFIGLTQSDVAYYFRHGGHPLYSTPHLKRDNVVALGKAIPEFVFILSALGGNHQQPLETTYPEQSAKWSKLFYGSIGSGTLISAINLLPVLGEPTAALAGGEETRVREFFDTEGMIPPPESFSSNDGWPETPFGGAVVSAGLPEGILRIIEAGRGNLIPISLREMRHIRSEFSHFYRESRVLSETAEGAQAPIPVVEIPSLLVASRSIPQEVTEAVKRFFRQVDDESAGAASGTRYASVLWDRMPESDRPASLEFPGVESLVEPIRRYRDERFLDLVLRPHRSIVELRGSSQFTSWSVGLAFFALFLLLGRATGKRLKKSKGILDVSPLITIPLAITFVFTWIHICLAIVGRIELAHYLNYQVETPSAFISHSYGELLPKLLHYFASAFSSAEMMPSNQRAQIVWLTIPFIFVFSMLTSTFHVVVPPGLRYLKRFIQEETVVELNDHVVVCNWHPHARNVIRQLFEQAELVRRERENILLLVRSEEEVQMPLIGKHKDRVFGLGESLSFAVPLPNAASRKGQEIEEVHAIVGDPRNVDTLRMARVSHARAVIVFPDSTSSEPDGPTAITVLNIQRLAEEEEGISPRVIVWCADPSNVEIFLDEKFGVSDVCSTEWAWRIICQATQVRHVSNIYRRLMTSSEDTNEIYDLTLPLDFTPCAFSDIQDNLRKYNLALPSSSRNPGGQRSNNTVLLIGYIEREDVRRSSIHLNPGPRAELRQGDTLLLLAYLFDEKTETNLLAALSS